MVIRFHNMTFDCSERTERAKLVRALRATGVLS